MLTILTYLLKFCQECLVFIYLPILNLKEGIIKRTKNHKTRTGWLLPLTGVFQKETVSICKSGTSPSSD